MPFLSTNPMLSNDRLLHMELYEHVCIKRLECDVIGHLANIMVNGWQLQRTQKQVKNIKITQEKKNASLQTNKL